jgi:hypothetical protein
MDVLPPRPISIPSVRGLAAARPAAPGPAPAPGQTETQFAAEHLSSRSRHLLPDALLDAKIGRSTLAGSLNDQVRFRVHRTGQVADWTLEPDSPTAAALVASRAGAGLLRELTTAMRATGSLTKVSDLKGFILAEDTESVLAGRVLSWLDDASDPDGRRMRRLGELGRTTVAGRVMRKWGEGLVDNVAHAGAWNSQGWITFMPDTARAMLVNAGAYAPDKHAEAGLRRAGSWTDYLSGNGPHEVQHSVSGPSPTAYTGLAKWMEEGTANVFSRTPTYQRANATAANLLVHHYAGMLAHDAAFSTGWSAWKRPQLPKDKQSDYDKEVTRNYGRSQQVLRDLVHLAGGDFRSTAGKALAFELLQHKSMRYTPGVLADAIIAQHGLDPKVRERLRERIKGAVDIDGGVAALAREFGIES